MSLEFITRFPKKFKQRDAIMVVVYQLSKATHFIPIISTYKVVNISENFMKEFFILHGMPTTIISHKDPKFTSIFLKGLFEGLVLN
jgi:hypothetical protein